MEQVPKVGQKEIFQDLLSYLDFYVEYTHPHSGRYYYQNLFTGEVTWEKPAHFYTTRQLAKVLGHYWTVKCDGEADFSAMPDGIPFAQPAQPPETPSEQHLAQTHHPEMTLIDLKQAAEKRAEEVASMVSPRRAKSPRKIGGVQGKANLRQMFQESPEISTEDFDAMYNTQQQNSMQQNAMQQNVQYQQNPNMQQNAMQQNQYQNANQQNPNMQQYSTQQNGMQPQSYSNPQHQQPDNYNYNYNYNTYNAMGNDTYKSS